MPQFLDRWLEWFRTQRTDTQALIIAGIGVPAIIASVLLSGTLLKIALVVLAVALIGWIVQRGRGGPERSWQIAVGGSLVAVLIFAVLTAAVSGPTPTEQAEQARQAPKRQEPQPEPTTNVPEVTTPEPAASDTEPAPAEPAPKPEPELKPEPMPGHPPTIPGLTASEAVKSFELNELECAREEPSGLLYTCTSAGHPDYLLLYEGEIVGRGPRQIEGVEARLSLAGAEADLQLTAQSFLGGIASDMVEGEANRERAFNFVYNDQDITGKTTTTIGGVEFTLIGTADTKTLKVAPAQ